MSTTPAVAIAQEFLSRLGSEASAESIAELFSETLDWNIPGDVGAQSWLGRQKGRQAVINFISNTGTMITREKLEIHDIVGNDTTAIILGELGSRVNANGNLIETPFSVILTITDGLISRYLMLEDSFAVSQASRAA